MEFLKFLIYGIQRTSMLFLSQGIAYLCVLYIGFPGGI